jgi:phosphoinositide-3-kinase, regulatory subunit 4
VSVTDIMVGNCLMYYHRRSDATVPVHVESWPPRTTANAANRSTARRALVDGTQQALLRAHSDTICALVTIDAPFKGGLISGDRAGVIKVWRIEGSS